MCRILRTSRSFRGAFAGLLFVALGHGRAASFASSEAGSQTSQISQTSQPSQTSVPTGPQTVTDVLHRMSDRADVIFMGQVLAVRRPDSEGASSGVVEVEFRVDQAVRGCSVGTPYILREWGGLWVAGNQRYRVGQRLLMLLHAPSTGGMSSPVDGLDGAIPIRQGSTATPLTASSAPPALPYVDLRWLGVKVPRTVSYRTGPAPTTGPARQGATNAQQRTAYAVVPGARSVAPIVMALGNASPSDASVPDQEASVDAVLGLLTTWQKASNVAP
jgi:hypothetical protein